MPYRPTILLTALLLLPLAPAWAQTRPSTPLPEQVAQVVLDFCDALDANEVAKLRELIWVNDDPPAGDISEADLRGPSSATTGPTTQPGFWEVRLHTRARETFLAFVAARGSLHKAASARFGPDGARLSPAFGLILPTALRASLARYVQIADITRDITICVPGATRPIILRPGPQGNWQIVLPFIDELANSPLRGRYGTNWKITVLAERTRALETVTASIQQGKLATAAEAETALLELLAAAPQNVPAAEARPARLRPRP